MGKTTSNKISVKVSVAKTSYKPSPGYKILGPDPEIRFYTIEDSCDTEEV